MKCIKCGQEIPDTSTFCNFCGTPIPVKKNNNIIKIITILVLLVIVGVLVAIILLNNNKKEDNTNTTTTTTSSSIENTTGAQLNTSGTKEHISTTTNPNGENINYAENLDVSKLQVKPESNDTNTQNIKYLKHAYIKDIRFDNLEVLFENDNDFAISVSTYLNFYKDGVRLHSVLGSTNPVNPHTKFVITYTPKIYEEFDSFDITYKANTRKEYEILDLKNSDVKCDLIKEVSNKIKCTFTHNYDNKGTYYLGIIYKKNGNEIGYNSAISMSETKKKGDVGEVTFYDVSGPSDYDDYEVFVQSSYTY